MIGERGKESLTDQGDSSTCTSTVYRPGHPIYNQSINRLICRPKKKHLSFAVLHALGALSASGYSCESSYYPAAIIVTRRRLIYIQPPLLLLVYLYTSTSLLTVLSEVSLATCQSFGLDPGLLALIYTRHPPASFPLLFIIFFSHYILSLSPSLPLYSR